VSQDVDPAYHSRLFPYLQRHRVVGPDKDRSGALISAGRFALERFAAQFENP